MKRDPPTYIELLYRFGAMQRAGEWRSELSPEFLAQLLSKPLPEQPPARRPNQAQTAVSRPMERPEEPREVIQWREDQRREWYARLDAQHEAEERARASHEMALRGEARAIEAEARQIANMAEQRAYQARAERRSIQHHQEQQEYQWRNEQRAVESHEMHRESHALQMQRDAERQENERNARRLAKARFSDPKASGVLGNARYATLDDCRDMGLCDSAGLYLGVMPDDRHRRLAGLYYNGDRHLTTYAGTGAGKGVNLILPNLVLYGRNKPRSLIVVDVKNGENAYATAQHRAINLGHRVVFLNPSGLYGLPSQSLNPFSSVIHAPDSEKFDKAGGVASVLAPVLSREADNKWVNEGAGMILQATIAHLAATDPKHCTPGHLWEFFSIGKVGLTKAFAAFKTSPLASVRGKAIEFVDWIGSPDQWNAYSSAIAFALKGFGPESPYTKATEHSEFDARTITQEPTTVYLMMKADDLLDKGHWVSLMLNHLVRVTAAHPGPCGALFMVDEFTQLPPIPRILEAINLHGSTGQRFWLFAQDRETLEARYGKSGAGQFERQSGMVQTWDTSDIGLLKDWEYLSGKTSVQVINASMSDGGQVGTGLTLTEHTRPLFQPEDMHLSKQGTQFLRARHGPMVRAQLMPWYAIEHVNKVVHSTQNIPLSATLPVFYQSMMHQASMPEEQPPMPEAADA